MDATNEAARLSRLLFHAREEIEMWADVVEGDTGRTADAQRRLIAEIDSYRAERGWSPHGFGDEAPLPEELEDAADEEAPQGNPHQPEEPHRSRRAG